MILFGSLFRVVNSRIRDKIRPHTCVLRPARASCYQRRWTGTPLDPNPPRQDAGGKGRTEGVAGLGAKGSVDGWAARNERFKRRTVWAAHVLCSRFPYACSFRLPSLTAWGCAVTARKTALPLPVRTPAYVSREVGAAELGISPETWDRWVDDGILPLVAPGFPPSTPRWKWVDVDHKLSTPAQESTTDPFIVGAGRIKNGTPPDRKSRAA